jgi:hypothetical protein
MEIPVRMRQTRMHSGPRESPPGFKCQTRSTRMKDTPTDDALFGKGYIRRDGRKIHNMYLFEVKAPAESKGPYDYYKLIRVIPGEDAFRAVDKGDCSLVTHD